MENVDRREFLGASIAGGAAAWFAAWFGQDPQGKPTESEAEKALRAAVQKAKDQGKPLLVFVAPPDPTRRASGARSTWLGAWLDHGGPTALLEVALCVPVCATLDDVQRITGAAKIDGDPPMLVVDASRFGTKDGATPRVTPVVVEMPSLPVWSMPPEADPAKFDAQWEKARAEEEKVVRAGIEKLTTAFHQAMHGHGVTTAKSIEDVQAKATAEQREALAKWLEGGEPPDDDLLLRFAAEIRSTAVRGSDARRERLTTALSEATRRQFLERNLPGATWWDAHCGPCGMGYVPALCDRFLLFLTEPTAK